MDCNPNPDMQGFTVRLAIFLTHSGMAFLLKTRSEDPYEQIRMCFYALFFQLFPIIIGTLVSFIQGSLSPGDAWFALLVMLSPTTLELLDLLPFDLRRHRKWSLREIIDGVSIILLLVLSIILYIRIAVFLSGQIDACPLEGFYDTTLSESGSRTVYCVSFAISLITVCLTIVRMPGYRTMSFLLNILLWAPARGSKASKIITIVFSIIEGMQTLGAVQPKCVLEQWSSQIAHFPHANSPFLPIVRKILMLGKMAMTFALFADPTGRAVWVTMVLCLIGELVVALPAPSPVISWVQISASWIKFMNEAACRIHPGHGAFQSALFYAQWGLMLEVTSPEPHYQLTYGQIVASLSFLPIAAECLKFAFEERHRLSLRSLRLAALPLWPSQYEKLSHNDVFPEEFWESKTRTAVVASILGLSWAGCVVTGRLPTHTTMRTVVYSAYPSIRFPEVLGDYVQNKLEDSISSSSRLHEPIEMKTMPPSTLPESPQITPLPSAFTTSFISEIIVEEPGGILDTEGSVVVNTGRGGSTQLGSAIRSRASLPHPVTAPRQRAVNTFWGHRSRVPWSSPFNYFPRRG